MSSPASLEQSALTGIFGLNRFAAYAEDADPEDDKDDKDENEVRNYNDDDFTDPIEAGEISIDDVSVMPVSCLRYNNGHMIKFELFENSSNYQCHFKNLGTYVVSIAHFMRSYFNHQALLKGRNFKL